MSAQLFSEKLNETKAQLCTHKKVLKKGTRQTLLYYTFVTINVKIKNKIMGK